MSPPTTLQCYTTATKNPQLLLNRIKNSLILVSLSVEQMFVLLYIFNQYIMILINFIFIIYYCIFLLKLLPEVVAA